MQWSLSLNTLKQFSNRLCQASTQPFVTLGVVGLGLSMAVSGCGSSNSTSLTAATPSSPSVIAASSSPSSAQTKESQVIRIGYQKYGTLNILKAKGFLEDQLKPQGVTVQWIQFPGGPQLLEALNAGSIDYGHTGEAPPIFAQAAGAPFVYVGYEPSNPKGEAILVPQGSSIQSVAELKGKKVALNKGSNVHYLLVKSLEAAGVKYSDIKPVFLKPAEGRAAFENGSVDAWVIWDPFFTAAKRATGARVLKDGEGLVANREFYLAAKSFAQQYPERVKTILAETQKIDDWAVANPTEVAKLLSPQLGIDVPSLEEVSKRRPYGVKPIDAEVVAYQQDVADTFHELKLLPQPVSVKEVAELPKP